MYGKYAEFRSLKKYLFYKENQTMKKYMTSILLITVLLIFTGCSQAETMKSLHESVTASTTLDNLKGDVKEVKTSSYSEILKMGVDGGYMLKPNDTVTKCYDPNGMVTKESRNDIEGNLVLEINESYSEKGILEKKTYKKIKSSEIIDEFYEYENDFKTMKCFRYDDGEVFNLGIYKYNDEYLPISEEQYIMGDLIYGVEYIYDEMNRVIKENHFQNSRETEFTIDYEYNEKGLISVKTNYSNSRDETIVTKYEYDEFNNVILKNVVYKDKTSIYKYKLTYDDNNNWILKEEFQKRRMTSKVEREIIYY